jgi:hypothetical protein
LRPKRELLQLLNRQQALRNLVDLCEPEHVVARRLLESKLVSLEDELRAAYQELTSERRSPLAQHK